MRLVRFELTTSSFGGKRSSPTELQAQILSADAAHTRLQFTALTARALDTFCPQQPTTDIRLHAALYPDLQFVLAFGAFDALKLLWYCALKHKLGAPAGTRTPNSTFVALRDDPFHHGRKLSLLNTGTGGGIRTHNCTFRRRVAFSSGYPGTETVKLNRCLY